MSELKRMGCKVYGPYIESRSTIFKEINLFLRYFKLIKNLNLTYSSLLRLNQISIHQYVAIF